VILSATRLSNAIFGTVGQAADHFAINGQPLGAGQDNIISASQLNQTTNVAGSGSDTLWVRVSEGGEWSAWSQSFTVAAPPETGPIVTFPTYIYTTLDDPSATHGTFATGINDLGQIVGYYQNSAGYHGFFYSNDDYITLDDPSATGISTIASGIFISYPPLTTVAGINSTETIVGDYETTSGYTLGFLFSKGSYYNGINDPSATIAGTFLSGINNGGQIVGTYENYLGTHGFLYSSLYGLSSYTTLDDVVGNTFANGINDAGQVVGQYYDGTKYDGFLYQSGSYSSLDDPAATTSTSANGINNAAQIVGTYADSSGNHAFLYQAGNYVTLDDPSAAAGTTNASGINNAGQIVGIYSDNSGGHGFLATPVIGSHISAQHGQSFAAQSLFTASDPDGDTITQYGFWNTGSGGGHFVLNGVLQPSNQEVDVSATQLAPLTYQSGSGTNTLWVRAYDGMVWGPWSQALTVTAPIDTGPTVASVSNITTVSNQTFAASTLFTASDPFNDPIEQYDFWDAGMGGGHFTLNGQPLGSNEENVVSAAQLGQASYVSGSGTDTLWVRVSEGGQWSPWSSSFIVSDPTTIGAGETLELTSSYSGQVSLSAPAPWTGPNPANTWACLSGRHQRCGAR
jgi:probable HAF family extracellular repeat protein